MRTTVTAKPLEGSLARSLTDVGGSFPATARLQKTSGAGGVDVVAAHTATTGRKRTIIFFTAILFHGGPFNTCQVHREKNEPHPEPDELGEKFYVCGHLTVSFSSHSIHQSDIVVVVAALWSESCTPSRR